MHWPAPASDRREMIANRRVTYGHGKNFTKTGEVYPEHKIRNQRRARKNVRPLLPVRLRRTRNDNSDQAATDAALRLHRAGRIGYERSMAMLVKQFVQAFIPLFVAIDPIGLAAIFFGLGQGVPPALRQRIARQATITGGGVALAFLFLGQSIFRALGISVSDFQIAGGLILFVLAARDLVLAA